MAVITFNESPYVIDLEDATEVASVFGETDPYQETGSEQDEENVRHFWVPWQFAHCIRFMLYGHVGWDGGNIVRTLPLQHPRKPWLWAKAHSFVKEAGAWQNDDESADFASRVATLVPGTPSSGQAAQLAADNQLLQQQPGGGVVAVAPPDIGKAGGVPPVIQQPGPQAPQQPAPPPGLPRPVPADQLPPAAPCISYFDPRGDGTIQDGKILIKVTFGPHPEYLLLTDDEATAVQQTYKAKYNYDIPRELARFVIRRPTFAVQARPLGKLLAKTGTNVLQFAAGTPFAGTQVNDPGILIEHSGRFEYQLLNWPAVPWDAINAATGRCNVAQFDGLPNCPVFTPGQLLMAAPKVEWKTGTKGALVYNITYSFDFKAAGWNAFPSQNAVYYPCTFGGGAINYTTDDTKSNTVFKFADFNALFVCPKPLPQLP